MAFGKGCVYAPDKIHMHGIDYNTILKDSVMSSTITGYLLCRLINRDNDNKITISARNHALNEGSSLKRAVPSVLERIIEKIKIYLGAKVDLLINEELLNQTINTTLPEINDSDGLKRYAKEIQIKSKLNTIVQELNAIFDEGYQYGITTPVLENHLVNALIQQDTEK
jgi:hypothetical protein